MIESDKNLEQSDPPLTTSSRILNEKKITLGDGSVYEGLIDHLQRPHGQGKQVYPNGDVYVGFFVEGQKNGMGKLEKKGQFTYYGNFNRNKMSGQGTMYFEDGRRYKGEFMDGKFNGEGELTVNGQSLKGKFLNGVLSA